MAEALKGDGVNNRVTTVPDALDLPGQRGLRHLQQPRSREELVREPLEGETKDLRGFGFTRGCVKAMTEATK